MKIGFYESDITPPLGEIMPGYFSERRAVTVHDKLYSKAMAIQIEKNISVIISVDCCFIPDDLHDFVTERISRFAPISPDSVSITSNHTHLGGPISECSLTGCEDDKIYTDVFYRLVADSAILAYQNLSEASLSFGKAPVDGLTFCRNLIMKNGTYVTNTDERENVVAHLDVVDNELTALFALKDGKPIGALVSFPLHQDTVHPEVLGYSGDYASVISKRLKEVYGPDFVTVFGIGVCGDVNHIDYTQKEVDNSFYTHRPIGERLANALFEIYEHTNPIDGLLIQQKEKLVIKRRKLTLDELKEKLAERFDTEAHAMNIGNLVSYYMLDLPDETSVYIHVIAIGDLAIYILPGEMFSCYGLRIKEESPFKYNMVIENSNSNAGYIPSLKAFEPQSRTYESVPAESSNLIPEAGNIITDKALEMAQELI